MFGFSSLISLLDLEVVVPVAFQNLPSNFSGILLALNKIPPSGRGIARLSINFFSDDDVMLVSSLSFSVTGSAVMGELVGTGCS